ncbi:MAG: helix-turn-helix domain-containing protein [Cytophagales bacterium]|nr:helix-turn-helix domain-containing protein [Cytophagales bacterium]
MIIDGKKYQYRLRNEDFHCALDVTMRYIGGKWKAVVLWYLRHEKRRFSKLKALIPDITDKMLSLQLKSLEEDGIVTRTVYSEVPIRVEYELSTEGQTLIPMIEAMAGWGRNKAEREGRLVPSEK